MPHVNFYIFNQATLWNPLFPELLETAISAGHNVLIATPSLDSSNEIDQYLWQYRIESFLPHLVIENDGHDAPILISHLETPLTHQGILINLTSHILENYTDYEHIIEFVLEDGTAKKMSRIKYKKYQQLGCPLQVLDKNNG